MASVVAIKGGAGRLLTRLDVGDVDVVNDRDPIYLVLLDDGRGQGQAGEEHSENGRRTHFDDGGLSSGGRVEVGCFDSLRVHEGFQRCAITDRQK